MTKINWYNGKTANSASDMQKLCDAVNRSLLTPESAPADTKVVAVDNTNSQKMLTIGDGLSIENDTLKASSGSGEKLYLHNINIMNIIIPSSFSVTTLIITKNNTIFTNNSFYEYLTINGCMASGTSDITDKKFVIINKVRSQGEQMTYVFDGIAVSLNNGVFKYELGETGASIMDIQLVDTVIEL